MTHKMINRGIAAMLFLFAEAVYLMTMAPTLSFWDCGEFIATAYTPVSYTHLTLPTN